MKNLLSALFLMNLREPMSLLWNLLFPIGLFFGLNYSRLLEQPQDLPVVLLPYLG